MRSAEAAKNTSNMIEESVKNAQHGVDIATEVGKVLNEIVQSVGKTTDLVAEIAAASQEQAQGIDQVNTAVAQMDKVTQQNAANAEESASASEQLSAQAETINEVANTLAVLVGGNALSAQRRGQRPGGRRQQVLASPQGANIRQQPQNQPNRLTKSGDTSQRTTKSGKQPVGSAQLSGTGSIPLDESEGF